MKSWTLSSLLITYFNAVFNCMCVCTELQSEFPSRQRQTESALSNKRDMQVYKVKMLHVFCCISDGKSGIDKQNVNDFLFLMFSTYTRHNIDGADVSYKMKNNFFMLTWKRKEWKNTVKFWMFFDFFKFRQISKWLEIKS